jgi:hypothetical protein
MVILIDYGSNHSFINEEFVHHLNLKTNTIPGAQVKLANVECNQLVPALEWLAH